MYFRDNPIRTYKNSGYINIYRYVMKLAFQRNCKVFSSIVLFIRLFLVFNQCRTTIVKSQAYY